MLPAFISCPRLPSTSGQRFCNVGEVSERSCIRIISFGVPRCFIGPRGLTDTHASNKHRKPYHGLRKISKSSNKVSGTQQQHGQIANFPPNLVSLRIGFRRTPMPLCYAFLPFLLYHGSPAHGVPVFRRNADAFARGMAERSMSRDV